MRTVTRKTDQATAGQLGHDSLDAARDALNTLIEEAKRLKHQHDEAAEKTAEAVRRAAEEAPDEPGLLDRIGDVIK